MQALHARSSTISPWKSRWGNSVRFTVSIFSVARRSFAVALALSLQLHFGVGMWVKVRSSLAEDAAPPPADVWSGRGIEVAAPEVDTVFVGEPAAQTPIPNADQRVVAAERTVTVEPACTSDCTPQETKTAPRAKEPLAGETAKRIRTPKAVSSAPSVASATNGSPTATPSAAASGEGFASSAGDAFGMAGLPPGVRHLPKAFTRALNQGSWRVAGFRTVPAGKLCEGHVAIAVGADRRLGELEYPRDEERRALPALCRTMFENAHRLVANGEFSLDPKRLTDGTMRLRVEVHVSDGEPPTESDAPNELFSESYETPGAGKRGRSTFIFNSGRRVDAFVEVE
jgi:hypothetical protein